MQRKLIISIFLALFLANSPLYADVPKNSLVGEGYSDEEIAYLEKVLRLDPDNFGIYYALGVAYYRKGDYAQVIECYQKFTQGLFSNPNYVEASRNLEMAYARIRPGQYRTSLGFVPLYSKGLNQEIDALAKALQINPKISEVYIYLAGSRSPYPQVLKEEIGYLEQALEINPDNFGTYYALTAAYYRKGDYEKVFENLVKFTELNPGCALSHYGLGVAYYNTEDTPHAQEQVYMLRSFGRDDLADDLAQLIGLKTDKIAMEKQAFIQLKTRGLAGFADFINGLGNYSTKR